MNIEIMQEKHITRLVELVLIFKNEKEHHGNTVNPELIKEQFNTLLHTDNSVVYVACENNLPEAYIIGHFISFPILGGLECYISDLLVNPGTRSGGYGTKLLQCLEDEARSRGCVRLMLNNLKSMESYKRQFYIKKGFQERTQVANMVKILD